MSEANAAAASAAKKPAEAQERIYLIYPTDGEGNQIEGKELLVNAQNNNQAFRAAGVAQFGVKVASTKDVLRLVKAGVEIKNAIVRKPINVDTGGTGDAPAPAPTPAPVAATSKKKK